MNRLRAGFGFKKLPPDIETFGVFCIERIDMEEVEVYGFDYD